MQRTQIYLDSVLYNALSAVAAVTGETLSEVIRVTLRRGLEAAPALDPIAAVDQAVGAWAEDDGRPATAEYVRNLRRSTRMDRHGRSSS